MLQFVLVWIILSIFIFSLLIYLTGGINEFFYLEKGFFYDNRSLSWNASEHINITIAYDPGTSLFVVALLSGLLYATLITLPPVCTILPDKSYLETIKSTSGKTTSVTSSMSAAASAFASTAVCCSTSVVAVAAPSVSVLLGPFVPGLLFASFILLIYSFYKVVMPRFPVELK